MFYTLTNRLAKLLAGFAMGFVVVSAALADDIALSTPQDIHDPVSVALPEGFIAEPAEVLQVFVGSAEGCCDNSVAVAGKYALEDNLLSFTPAFGFSADVNYVARIEWAQSQTLTPFSIASNQATVPAAVIQIYPSGDVLPENVLRFYIHFSAPMKPGVAFDYVKLRDASGKADDSAFMRFKQELWNADRTRLTVLIDPGRVKREVPTNREIGPALVAGNQYTLSVDGGWPSVDGKSTLAPFTRKFSITDALRQRPDVNLWNANSPCFGTKEPLTLQFDRPFDRHLLNKSVHVTTANGQRIAGEIDVGAGERSLRFVPDESWDHRDLYLTADASLEDVAANNFLDLLDHVQGTKITEVPATTLAVNLRSCPSN